jgi:hypothetical protein
VAVLPGIEQRPAFVPFRFGFSKLPPQLFERRRCCDDRLVEALAFHCEFATTLLESDD